MSTLIVLVVLAVSLVAVGIFRVGGLRWLWMLCALALLAVVLLSVVRQKGSNITHLGDAPPLDELCRRGYFHTSAKQSTAFSEVLLRRYSRWRTENTPHGGCALPRFWVGWFLVSLFGLGIGENTPLLSPKSQSPVLLCFLALTHRSRTRRRRRG
jgi:hypothetical protein